MIYVILGQTASGKTSTALYLARKHNVPIISADAYQCFKMMQIGTDKPTEEELDGVTIHYCDCYNPDFVTDVCNFQKSMREVLDSYVSQGKDVIVVGGTFLYIKALLFNYVFYENDEDIADLQGKPLEELQNILKELDPSAYDAVDLRNERRVISAIRNARSGHTREEIVSSNDSGPLYDCRFFEIKCSVEDGNRKIDERVDRMFESGFPDEVRRLMERYPRDLKSFSSIGYRECMDYIDGKTTEKECRNLIKIHTHQYAKRQRTFLRHQFDNSYSGTKDVIQQTIDSLMSINDRSSLILSSQVRAKINNSRVLLAGLGGVGGEVLEGLARLSFHHVTAIDKDVVDASNLNRQTLYTFEDIGVKKCQAAKKRINQINPLVDVTAFDKYITDVSDLGSEKYDVVIDAIDATDGKVALYLKARNDNAVYITSCGLGNHIDSTKVKIGRLKDARDPLAAAFKEKLAANGISKEEIESIACVYATDGRIKHVGRTIGSVVTVPNAGGLAIISYILQKLETEG